MKPKLDVTRSERGQVLVLIVLAVVAMLGFAALAIDGSMLYSNRRYAQNSADASSLAGAAAGAQWISTNGISYSNWNCGSLAGASTTAKTAAVTRAAQNGFVITAVADEASLPDPKMGVYTVCNQAGRYMDIHTWVSHNTQTAFAHFVFKGLLRNTVEAVVRLRPPTDFAFGYAIVALNPAVCTGNLGVGFQGNSGTVINGGGVFSNGCLKSGGSFSVDIYNGNVLYNDLKNPADDDNIIMHGGTIAQTTEQIPASSYAVPPIDCSKATYTGAWPPPNITNLSGLYCITGNISINAGNVVNGTGVTIYVQTGKLTINGGATVTLSAPAQGSSPVGAVEGLLWYLPPTNNSAVTINGGSSSSFVGTILAPSSTVSYEGNEGSSMIGQIIGWDVFIAGTASSGVVYNGGVVAQIPTYLDLYK